MGNLKIFSKDTINRIKHEFNNNKIQFSWIFIFIVFIAITFELFNRPFGEVRNLKIAFDDMIPFIKEFIIIYHTFSPMLVVVGLLLLVDKKNDYKKYIVSLLIAQLTAYVIFILFQTYVPRYDTSLLGNDIFSKLIKLTYSVDNSYSGAPSLHVCNMTIAIFYFTKSNYTKKDKIIMNLYLALIAITTVLVKQHVVLDIPAGLIHAIVCYIIVEFTFKSSNIC